MKPVRELALASFLAASAMASTAIAANAASDHIFLSSAKLGVNDFDRSIAFYTKYFGLAVGKQYIAAERNLYWRDPSGGPGVVLVHDETGKLKLPPGCGWLVFRIPDAAKMAADFRSDGLRDFEEFSQKISETAAVQVIMIKDPDGNQLELLQMPKDFSN